MFADELTNLEYMLALFCTGDKTTTKVLNVQTDLMITLLAIVEFRQEFGS